MLPNPSTGGAPNTPTRASITLANCCLKCPATTGALTYTRYLVPVTVINGQTVYLKPGSLPANAVVVTQGAEELLGVQNGVGEET